MNENKVVWIIGATGGIGRCIVSNLKNEDWTVVGSARDESNLENLSNEMGIKIHPVDARNNSDMQNATLETLRTWKFSKSIRVKQHMSSK